MKPRKTPTKPKAAPPAAPPALPVTTLDVLAARFPPLIARWLDLFEASLQAAEHARATEPPPTKPPDAATLREVVNALTLCVRLQQLTTQGDTPDADQARRDLEAVERAISESAL